VRVNTWPKVTGGKGLHVMAPLKEKMAHDEAHAYSKALVERIAKRDAKRYTTSAAMAQRPGRLFLDYLRNGRGTTACWGLVAAGAPRLPDRAASHLAASGGRDKTGCFHNRAAVPRATIMLRRASVVLAVQAMRIWDLCLRCP
jgi:hypothetical protein